MKSLIYIIVGLLLLVPVISLEVPKEDNTQLIQNIHQEHGNTRKYFSDELSRNRNEFFKEMDSRANYYEEEVDNMLTTAVWKLALLWGGVVFFIVAFNNVLRIILEKKRFKKFKESLKGEILNEMAINNTSKMQQHVTKPIFEKKKGFEIETDELFKKQTSMPMPPQPKKKGYFARRKEAKQQKKYNKLLEEQEKLRKQLGLQNYNPQPPQQQPQTANINYSNSFEVEY